MKSRLPAAIAVLLQIALSSGLLQGREVAQGSFERRLNVSGAVELDVSTGAGQIQVRPGEASSLHVSATIRVHDMDRARAEEKVRRLQANPPIEQTGNIIRIGHIQDRELSRNVSISYELTVPAATRLRSQTGSGNQEIEGIRGPLNASTGSGDLTISKVGEEVSAETGSGRIELDAIEGKVRASTGSGSIQAAGVRGDFEVSTGSGSVTATGVRGSLRASTGSGSITAEGEPAREWILHSGSGSISVRLPAEAAFDLDAHTSSGGVSIDHPFTAEGSLRPNALRGKVRGGGFRLEAHTSSGNIHIH